MIIAYIESPLIIAICGYQNSLSTKNMYKNSISTKGSVDPTKRQVTCLMS